MILSSSAAVESSCCWPCGSSCCSGWSGEGPLEEEDRCCCGLLGSAGNLVSEDAVLRAGSVSFTPSFSFCGESDMFFQLCIPATCSRAKMMRAIKRRWRACVHGLWDISRPKFSHGVCAGNGQDSNHVTVSDAGSNGPCINDKQRCLNRAASKAAGCRCVTSA